MAPPRLERPLSRPNSFVSVSTASSDHSEERKPLRERLSVNTQPQDMLGKVRRSISSKHKNTSLTEVSLRSQSAIKSVRDSFDAKRISTSSNLLLPFSEDFLLNASFVSHSSRDSMAPRAVYEKGLFTGLFSSIGLLVSEEQSPSTPAIVVDEAPFTPKQKESTKSPPSGKLKRKPPPDIGRVMSNSSVYEEMDASLYFSVESRSPRASKVSVASFDGRADSAGSGTSGTSRIPQFPDFARKKLSEHHFFKKRYKMKGVDSSVNLLTDDDKDEVDPHLSRTSLTINRPAVASQPIKMKTTMRKTRRKDKKLEFNDIKPWKNHSELNAVLDAERKRYEGVWVSNKGRYMDHVVTRLLGVDYTKQRASQDTEDISAKAARLSSKNVHDGDSDKLHELQDADISQLIHGVVVKRIWQRSRLPAQTLEAIWNLVDFRNDGTLNKAEFLVGMWLVDQCLYGRKLPKKVDDVVWESLGHIGVTVVKRKHKR